MNINQKQLYSNNQLEIDLKCLKSEMQEKQKKYLESQI